MGKYYIFLMLVEYLYGINLIYFYIPNIIDYLRITLTFISGYYTTRNYLIASIWYSLSYFLDSLDGLIARYFNQCSRLGSLLDMITDRLSTLGLSFILSGLYPKYWNWFTIFSILDICSHWFKFTSSLENNSITHKCGRYWIISFYYTFPYILLIVCISQEFIILLLFLNTNIVPSNKMFNFMLLHLKILFPIFF